MLQLPDAGAPLDVPVVGAVVAVVGFAVVVVPGFAVVVVAGFVVVVVELVVVVCAITVDEATVDKRTLHAAHHATLPPAYTIRSQEACRR